jgi:hypothetical protein
MECGYFGRPFFAVYPIQFKTSDEPNSELILDEGIPVYELAMCDIN